MLGGYRLSVSERANPNRPHAQGLVVTFMATRMGWTPDDSEALLNWLICVEMLFAAVGARPGRVHRCGRAWRKDFLGVF